MGKHEPALFSPEILQAEAVKWLNQTVTDPLRCQHVLTAVIEARSQYCVQIKCQC